MVGVFAAEAGNRRIEFAVCAGHDEHIRSGGDWRLVPRSPDPNDYGLELACDPDDLAGDRVLLVESGPTLTRSTSSMMSSRPEATDILSFETRRWGRPEVDELELQFTRAQLLALRDTLIMAYGDRD
jgi:hypothetical protein